MSPTVVLVLLIVGACAVRHVVGYRRERIRINNRELAALERATQRVRREL